MTRESTPPPKRSSKPTPPAAPPPLKQDRELLALLGAAGMGILSPIEQRLLKITAEFMMTALQQVRIQVRPGEDPILLPVTVSIMKEAVRLAMAAAIECDDQLRVLRAQLAKDLGR